MATSPQRKTVLDARKGDLISQLPTDIKERILECLPTRDAARIALLSTHWNHVWLQHGRLVFDTHFFQCVSSKGEGDKTIALVNIINNILLLRDGRIKKFALQIYNMDPQLQQSDIVRWCRFLSRNGLQELTLDVWGKYKLPSCIFSCSTIKQLKLHGLGIDLGINARCIFPGLTSLFFSCVDFSGNVNGTVYTIPNLEKLGFRYCEGVSNFEISAPKLKRLMVAVDIDEVESRWFWLHFKAITTLCLYCVFFTHEDGLPTLLLPTATNLQVIQLSEFSFYRAELWVAMQLLQKSPNLCELGIRVSNVVSHESYGVDIFDMSSHGIEAASRFLKDLDGCIINQEFKMLNTIKIESFGGSTLEMLFVKILLSRSPALESLIIQEYYGTDAMAVRIQYMLFTAVPRGTAV